MVVFTHTNALAKDFQNDRKVKAQTWHSFFRWNGVGEWTPERMGEKIFLRVVIWDEVCTVPRHILKMFINYLLEQKCQIICCGDLLHFSLPIPSSVFPAEEVLKENVSFLKLTTLLLAFGLFLEVVLRFWNSPGLYTPIFWNVIYGVADFTKTFLWA